MEDKIRLRRHDRTQALFWQQVQQSLGLFHLVPYHVRFADPRNCAFANVPYSAFLLIATYLIMGSFLNRSKYGAEGFDSVPHADFWREFPYTVKDWGRSIVGMVQGHSSRGGYSAV